MTTTTQPTTTQIISAKLVVLTKSGKSLKEAFAIVLPGVDFDAMIGDLYDALKAEAAK